MQGIIFSYLTTYEKIHKSLVYTWSWYNIENQLKVWLLAYLREAGVLTSWDLYKILLYFMGFIT